MKNSAGTNDVEEQSDGSIFLERSDLELSDDGSESQHVGLRYEALGTPEGAIISGAYLQFRAGEVSTGYILLTIEGEAAIAAMVNSWNVDFILTAGDNNYGGIDYDEAIGQRYANYIGNYSGVCRRRKGRTHVLRRCPAISPPRISLPRLSGVVIPLRDVELSSPFPFPFSRFYVRLYSLFLII